MILRWCLFVVSQGNSKWRGCWTHFGRRLKTFVFRRWWSYLLLRVFLRFYACHGLGLLVKQGDSLLWNTWGRTFVKWQLGNFLCAESFWNNVGYGLSHWDLYAVHRGGCLELCYCNTVEWCWWDSSLICETNWFPSVLWHCWFGHMTCKNRPQYDL